MKHQKFLLLTSLLLSGYSIIAEARQWTLQQCLDYAMENNIQLKQKVITTKSSKEDVLQAKGALFPTVSFSTSQDMNYRPFSDQTINLSGGTMSTSKNAVSYNGSYGINANWTVWNGGKNRMEVEKNKLEEQQNEYAEQLQANTIQEQIAQLFVQILYETEAIKVSEEVLKASQMQFERAKQMVEIGSLARVDQVQLEAQVAQDELNVVNAKSQLENYKLQLRQLLEIHDNEPFEVIAPVVSDEKVLALIPQKEDVYNTALEKRPEILTKRLSIQSSDLALKNAKAGYMPTVSVNAGIGTSNASAQNTDFGTQIKNNLSGSLGLKITVPIVDGHQNRTNVRKAKYAQETAQLQLQDAEKQLYSDIEKYYLDASTNQQKFVYAKKNAESMQESYDLVSEQFRLGLKNIVELTTGKNDVLQAKQKLLETKYTALFNQAMLRFYKGESIEL